MSNEAARARCLRDACAQLSAGRTNEDGDEIETLERWRQAPGLVHVDGVAAFEPEDEALAIAELDLLHADLGAPG
jgi:hypothetical protein